MNIDATGKQESERTLLDVLVEFQGKHPLPDLDEVRAMQALHPEHHDAIEGFAAMMADMVLSPEFDDGFVHDPRDDAFAQRMLDAFPGPGEATPTTRTLAGIMGDLGLSVEGLAVALGVIPEFIASLVEGGMRPPAGRRLIEGLSGVLGRPARDVRAILEATFARPSLGQSSSHGVPTRLVRSYAELVAACIPEKDWAHWLAE